MSEEIDYYKHLATIMYQTRGCRFTASSRLKRVDFFSISTIAFLSIYFLTWSVISLSYPEVITSSHSRFFNAISVVAAVALLSISIFDFALGRSVVAEKLNRNALEISILMRALERELARQSPDPMQLATIASDYEKLVAENQTNHTGIDRLRWSLGIAKSKNSFISVLYTLRRLTVLPVLTLYSLSIHLILIACVVVPTLWYMLRVITPISSSP